MAVTKRLGNNLLNYGTAGDVVAGELRVRKILWVGATTVGHNVDFKDGSGNALFSLYAPGTGCTIDLDFGDCGFRFPDGLEMDVKDSGSVSVFLK